MKAILTLENPSDELLKALKSIIKMANVKFKLNKTKKLKEPEFYTLDNSPAIQKIDKWAQEHPELAKQAKIELEAEMKSYENHLTQSS